MFDEMTLDLTGATNQPLLLDKDFLGTIGAITVGGDPFFESPVTQVRFRVAVPHSCGSFQIIHSARNRADPNARPALLIIPRRKNDGDCLAGLVIQTGDKLHSPALSANTTLRLDFRSHPESAAFLKQRVRCVSGPASSVRGAGTPAQPEGMQAVREVELCSSDLEIQSAVLQAQDPDGDLKVVLTAGSDLKVSENGEDLAWYRRLRIFQIILEKLAQ